MALIQHDARVGSPMRALPSPALRVSWPRWGMRLAPALLTSLAMLGLWQLVVLAGITETFILPAPGTVFSNLLDLLKDGTLSKNAGVTLEEAGGGLAIAAAIALPLGYVVAHVKTIERLVSPLLAASQAIPAVAIAPLLVTGLGTGVSLKVTVCAVIVIFPLLVNAITAFRGVAREYLEVAKVFGVSPWERIVRVEIPLAAPVLLAGLKLGVTLSLTGAIVGEFVAADEGLGFLLNYYHESFDPASAFATLVLLAGISIALYSFVSMLERMVAKWQG